MSLEVEATRFLAQSVWLMNVICSDIRTAIGQSIAGTRQGQTYDFAFDPMTDLFVGTVENASRRVVCASRTGNHVGTAGGGELGPTIPQDLAAGDILDVVMYLHPPGQAVTTVCTRGIVTLSVRPQKAGHVDEGRAEAASHDGELTPDVLDFCTS